ncbi:D-2-hydroxyacid dehydrogenase [Crateriforma conspicua]|uniref:Glycerate dehydrogenase n=1 Tax=Crateriforma conspicua TaxID=2527996 RepID=A0A5C5Y286_9PLAN|nr:D-2-hydroxyacid dehydrogenase [Crateriforma conspicua]TWT68355.1 Glycerate dehydrogenase [Crateriforma conspicua]
MKIVVTDAHTANPGDLSWDALSTMGDVQVYPRTATDEIIPRCQDADVVLTNKVPLNAETLAALPQLRYIGVTATGTNIIDMEAASQRGIVVTNVPDYSSRSVAQHVFAMVLELANQVGRHNDAVQDGQWQRCPDFSFTTGPLIELAGLSMGIIGFGSIGRCTATIARALGMNILAYSRTPPNPDPNDPDAFTPVGLDDLLAQSDVVSLHCPLTPQTHHLINAQRLSTMKSSAWLVNTSRGPVIDEEALASALRNGVIGAAALDVLDSEPMKADHPLMGLDRCIITPHVAWATVQARRRLIDTVTDNVRQWIHGDAVNVVN